MSDDGSVNEDVFAYANVGPGGERSLVVYHNRYAETSGTIRESVGFNARDPDGERRMRRETLADGLGLSGREDRWLRIRDAMTGLEGLRWSAGIARDGFRVQLSAYRCHVLVDLLELADEPGRPVATLAAELGDGWVPSVEDTLTGIALRPVHDEIRGRLAAAVEPFVAPGTAGAGRSGTGDHAAVADPAVADRDELAAIVVAIVTALDGAPFDERRLRPLVLDALRSAGRDGSDAERGADLVRGLVRSGSARRALDDATVAGWFDDPALGEALYVHDAGGIRWFDRDAFEDLAATVARLAPTPGGEPDDDRVARLGVLAEAAGYRVDELAAALRPAAGSVAGARAARARSGPRSPGAMTRLRWLTILVPVVFIGGFELLSDTLLDPYLPFPVDTLLVVAIVFVVAAAFSTYAFRRIDRLDDALRARNAELEARNASARALYEVSVQIAAIADLDEILRAIVEQRPAAAGRRGRPAPARRRRRRHRAPRLERSARRTGDRLDRRPRGRRRRGDPTAARDAAAARRRRDRDAGRRPGPGPAGHR